MLLHEQQNPPPLPAPISLCASFPPSADVPVCPQMTRNSSLLMDRLIEFAPHSMWLLSIMTLERHQQPIHGAARNFLLFVDPRKSARGENYFLLLLFVRQYFWKRDTDATPFESSGVVTWVRPAWPRTTAPRFLSIHLFVLLGTFSTLRVAEDESTCFRYD